MGAGPPDSTLAVCRTAAALLLVCMALLAAAGYGQDALAQPHVESAHYYVSDGAVEVRLDGSASWVNPQGIRLVGADGGAFVTGAVFHSGNVISITLGGARGDFEGLGHPRYVVVRAGGINGTDGVYNAEDLRAAISYDDTAPPQVSSAEYDAGTGILSVSFSEAVWGVDMGSVRVYGADGTGIAVAAGRHGPGDDAAYVDLEPGAAPATLSISAGGVADIWGNANSAELSGAVSVIGTISPPTNSTISPPTNSTISPPTNSTISPPTNSTISPPTNSTISPPTNSTISPPTNSTISPPTNSTISPPTNSTISPPTNSTISPPTNSTISPPTNSTISPPTNSTISPPTNSTISPPTNSTISPPTNSTISPPTNSTISPPTNSTISPPTNSTISPPTNSTISPPTNSTISPPTNSTISPPTNSTISPPTNSTISPPTNSTISPPTNSTISPPTNSTISPPTNSTISPPTNSTISPPTNSTISPPTNSTISPPAAGTGIPFSSVTYDLVAGEIRLYTEYNGILLAPPDRKNVTLTDGIRAATGPAYNPACLDPNSSCTGNDAIVTVSDAARERFADQSVLYVDAPAGILETAASGNTTGMTVALNHSAVTVLNPVFKGATYHTGNATISIQFSESVQPSGSVHVNITGGADAVSLSGNATAYGSAVYFVLSDVNRNKLANATSLRLDVGEGSVTGAGGYQNAAVGGKPVAISDGTRPVFKGAAYHTGNGTISVLFSEAVGAVNGSKFSITDGRNTVLLSGDLAIFGDAVVKTLNGTGQNKFAHARAMSLSMLQGAITDRAGNQIESSTANQVAVYDATKPIFSSAAYATGSGQLTITFSEPLDSAKHVPTKLHVRESGHTTGGVTLSNGTITANGTSSLTITLSNTDRTTVAGLTTPQLDVDAGAVSDAAGNQIAAVSDQTITVNDTTKPAILGATYHVGNGTVSVQFSETIKTANGSRINVVSDAHIVLLNDATVSGSAVVATLKFDDRTKISGASSLTLTVQAGAAHDMHGNSIDAVRGVPVDMTWNATETGFAEGASEGNIASFGANDFVTTWRTTTSESITIGVNGYNAGTYTVDWGDGTSPTTQSGDATHRYASAGTYNVSISGDFKRFSTGESSNAEKLIALVQWGNASWNHLSNTFGYANKMVYKATDIPNLVNVTLMNNMFSGAGSFNGDLSSWNVSSVTSMNGMFSGAGSFNGNVSTWDVSKVTNMGGMFHNADSFNGDLSSWDVSSVTNMAFMLANDAFNGDLSSWDVSSVTNMGAMFNGAASFNGDLSSWDVSSVTNMRSMFGSAPNFNGNVSTWDVSSVTDMSHLFAASSFNGDISSWDVSSVTDMSRMFFYSPFNGDISSWDVSSVTDMESMFGSSFNQNLGPWYVVLNNTLIRNGTLTVGHIAAQNSYLDGQNPTYSLVSGAGDTDNSLFTIVGDNLSIKQNPTKSTHHIRIGASGSNLFGQNNAVPITITADSTKPTFSSAAYATGSGQLTITFNEPLDASKHVPTKLHVRESGSNTGGVTLSNGTITTNGTSSLTITLSNSDRTTVAGLTTPQLDIDAGAVSDTAGNQIAAVSDQAITVNDTIKPTFSSASYKTGSGQLKITFSEPLYPAKHVPTKLHVRESGSNTGGVTLSNGTITTNGTNSLTITLSNSDRTTVAGLTTPQLDIEAGAVSDTSGNQIAAAADQAITVHDTLKPTFSSASYKTGSGELAITFSEPLDSSKHVATKLHVRESGSNSGGVTLSNGTITTNGTSSLTITLSNSDRTTVAGLTTPQLDIDAGAVSDTSGNAISAAADQAITVIDTMRPTLSSASYTTGSGQLTITFSEPLDSSKHVATKLHVRESGSNTGGVTLSNGTITTNGTNSLTITLSNSDRTTVAGLTTPQLDIDAGAVSDASGNAISAAADQAITVNDTIRPTFSSAAYATGSGELTITFSEPLDSSKHVATKLHVRESGSNTGGVTLSNGTITTNGTNSLTITLSNSDRTTVAGLTTPQLDIEAGAVSDTSGNQIAAVSDQTITVNDTIRPTFSSAAYATGSGELTITLSEPLDSSKHVATKLHVRESGSNTGGVTLSNGTITTNGTNSLTITLSNTDRTTVAGLTTPQLDIDAGAVSDASGNAISAAADQAITVNDTIRPTFTSATYTTGSGQLAITFSEPLDSAKHVATKLHVRESGSNTGGVTLSNGTITTNGTSSLTITLSNSDRTTVAGLTTPQLDIDAGAVSDTAGNQIAASVDNTITINDTIKPTFSSASYATGSGELTITFSEPLDSSKHVATKLHVRESGSNTGGVTLSNGTITTNGTNSLTITLSNSDRTTVAGLTTPQLDIEAGAVSDTSGNQIAAVSDQTITVNDTIRPTFSSAAYATGSGELTITFSEALNTTMHDASKIHVRDTGQNSNGVTLSNSIITTNGTSSITFDLSNADTSTVNAMTTPQIDIDAGAVRDTSGNTIAAAADQSVTVRDTILPTLSSASYATATDVLTVTLSEDIAKHNSTRIVLSGPDSGNVTFGTGDFTRSGKTLTATLNSTQKTAFVGLVHPRNITILPGGVTDLGDNTNAGSLRGPILYDDTGRPTYVSGTYYTGNGTLTMRFSEPLDITRHDAGYTSTPNGVEGITVTNPSYSPAVWLSNGLITKNGTDFIIFTLGSNSKQTVDGFSSIRTVIRAGSVWDPWNNPIARVDAGVTKTDTTRPTIASTTYATGDGILSITFSEALNTTMHDASKIHVRDTGQNSNGVTLSNSIITTNGTSSITFDLSNADTSTVNAMTTPQIDIDAGAVRDTSGNTIAAISDQTITINDTIKPTFSSAVYTTGSGELAITFSESLDSTKHVASKLHIRESGSNTGGVTLSNGTITTNGTSSLTITLSNSDRTTVAGLTTPQLDIEAGAVSDTSGNQIAAAADQAITVNDTIRPTFTSATYTTGSGQLAITFSEPLDSAKHVATKLHVRESGSNTGGVTLSNGTITTNGTNSLTITLSNSDRTTVAGLTTPQLDIDAGAVSDASGNQIAAAADQAITVNDTIRPTFSSAAYATGSGELAITFSEPLDSAKHVATKLHVRESGSNTGGVTLSNGTITTNGTNSLTITLSNSDRTTVAGLTTPQLDVDAGAVSDTSGNQIAAAADQAITVNDTIRPTFTSATYTTGSGQLAITFSEPLDSSKHVATKLHVRESGSNSGGVTLSNGTITTNGTNSLTITLSNSDRTTVAGLTTPQLDVDAGAVSDTSGNQIAAAADQAITVNDTIRPTFTSATYTTGSGQLAITFSEPLDSSKHVATKLHVRESGSNSGGVTLSNGTITTNGTNSLTITLSNSDRTTVAGLTTPQLDIEAGAVSDTSGNQIAAAADQAITVNDTIRPTFTSATYTTGSGQLAITFSEPLDASKHVATKLHVRESGSNTGGVTLSNGTITTNGTSSLTITLSNSDRTTVAGLTTPQLDIEAGAVSDTSGNQIAAAADQTITINDTIRPTFTSATYTTGSGHLTITFSEPLDSSKHVATKLHVRESGSNSGGVTLSNGTITTNGTNSLTITLSNSDRTTVAGLTTPQLDVDAGAVSDTAGNQIAAVSDQTITINDTIRPTFTSATYTTGSGQLAITFSEPLDSAKHVATKLHVRESGSNSGGVTLSNGTITTNGTSSLTITLSNSDRTTVAGLTTPQLDIEAGAVSDTSGNQIAAAADQAITVNDTIRPTFTSATYTTGSGQLAITFSEPLDSAKHVATKLHVRESGSNSGGVTLSNGTITTNGTSSLTITLSNSDRTTVAGLTTPQLDIEAGAVSDTSGNQIAAAADQAITVNDTIRPTFTSATYTTGSGQLAITFSEPLDSAKHVATKLHVRESGSNTGGVTLSNGTITTNGTNSLTITLSNSDRTTVAGLTTPQLDIEAGAVSDASGNAISAAADQAITINDTIKPTFSSAAYTTGSGHLTITFSEPLDSSKHVATKLHVRESGSNTGGVTLSNGTITTNGTNSLTITLSNSDRTTVAGLTTPQLDIEAGAVSDTSGNQIAAAADQAITVNDTIRPTFTSATYTTGSGHLTITFSEPLDSSKHVATKLHVRESGSNTGGVTLSNGTITTNGTNSLTITLSNSDRTTVAGLTTPQLDIEAGAVSDTSGNQIAAAADQAITVNDTIRPTFTSATYTTGSGHLTITFSEPLDSSKHVATKLHVRESGSNSGGVTLSNGTITTNGTNSLTITLSNSDRTTVAGLTTPQLDIEAGAVSDTSGNQIAAAADQAITVNDTIRPTFTSATYTTGSGHLTITFSEPLDSSKHVATKLHVRESGSNTGGVTLSNGTITTNGTNSLTITLSNSDRTTVAGLTTPQLDIEAGAVSDTSGNQIAAAADQAITVNDTIRPTFTSATYTTGSGHLTITFSEPLDSSKHVATKLHVRESGSNSGGVTLSNGTITTNGTNSLTITLSNSDRTTVAGLTTPQLDVDAGAVSDTSGNQIAAAADQAITVNDTIRPTFTSATYTTGSGQLAITFSEPLDASKHVATKLHVRESGSNSGGVTLSNGTITTNGTNSLTITLSNSDRTTVAGLTTPQLDIEAGAVSDTSGNQIAAAADQAITINDTIRPTFTSATYTSGSGQLAITFSEPLDSSKHVATKIHVRESGSNSGGVTLSNGTITTNGTNSLTITLSNSDRTTVAGLTTPQLDIEAGAVSDTSGNQIAAAADQAITINDTIRPTFTSATYTTGSGQLAITFSEPLDASKHVATKLHVRESGSNSGGVTLSNGTITTNGTNSLTITLSNSDRTTVAGLTTPQLDVDAGAVSDTSGNQIAAAADQAITINDTIRPTFTSATYTTGSGQLAITFSEPLDSSKHVATKIHVRESGSNSGGVTLSNGTITTNGTSSLTITLSNSDRTTVAGLTTPQLDIEAGAVSDTSGNQIAAAADQAITINDTIRPTFSSAAYATGSGELAITFSEPLDSSKHVATKIHVRESGSNSGGVTLSNGTITTNGTNSLTITLSNSDRTTVAGLTTPQLDIEAGAVSDTSGNQIAAAADQAITINDTIRPTFTSATYTTGSGQLAITFSEPLDSSKHVATKLHVRESGSNSGGVTLSNGTITTNGTNSLTITLSNSDRTTVAGLTTPQLDVDAGAVSDTSGNQIAAAADQAITINDTIRPTFSSAAYATGSGELAITFSEPLDSSKHVATKIHVRESGSNSGGVTLSNGTITTNGTSSLTITLSNSDRTTVAGLTTPQLDIEAGAVSDTSGNQIAAAADQAITINDTIRPTFTSATYTTGSGHLTITFSEPLDSSKHVATKLHVRESGSNSGGVTLSNGTITTNGTNSLTITLSNSDRTTVAGLTTPQLDVDAGAVSDTSGNQIAAAADQAITVNDTIRPTFTSATYTTGSGQLAITFSEPLDSSKHVATKIHVRESGSNSGGVTLSNGTITTNGTNSLTITLSNSDRTTVAGLTTPQLDIEAGAVSDTSGNQIAAAADQAITINDTIRPTFSSAAYATGSGELAITFSEPLDSSKHVATKIHVRESGSNSGGVTLSNGTITTNGTSSLTITLSNSDRTTVAGLTTPQLDIEAGAVSDTSGNQIAAAADQAITINDTIRPTFSSAAYATGSGELAITFSEPLDSSKHVATKIHVRESGSNSGGVTLSNGTITTNGTSSLTITLSNSDRTTVAGLTTPQLDIEAGAVSDTSGNQIAAAADQAITINDTIRPTFSSAAYVTGSGELAITFSEPLDSSKHVATKLHVRESGSNSGGVTLSNGTITTNGTNSLTITLSNSDRTTVAGLTTPQLDIEAGAVSDTSGNQIAAAADQAITINDTIRPTFSSAAYVTGSGELAITFSEPLDSSKHVATKLHVRESGSNSGGVTLSNGTITTNGTSSLTITLSNSDRTTVAGLTTPQLDIEAGAVSDTSGNQIAAAADQAITINDTIRPTFSSAAYATGSGELAITFSEPLDSSKHVATKLHVRESGSNSGGVTLSNGTITTNGTNSLTITLSNSDRTTVAGLTTPQLDIEAGAVSDTSGNQIAAAADQAITINDTIRPTFSSAAYVTGSGELAITFSEPLDSSKHVATKLHVRESGSNSGGVTLSNGTITTNGTSSLTITLSNSDRTTVAGLTTPQLDIEAGAVSDTSGNQIAAAADQAITVNDTIRPTFSSAAYATGSGELAITFSEPLDSSKHVATKLHVRESGSNSGGVTLSNGTITTNGTNSLTITLSNSDRTTVAGLTTPQLDIEAGAVSDTSGNQIAAAADQAITINDTIRPTFSSAAYATGSGELAITFSEPLDSSKHVATKLHVRESGSNSGGVTLSNGTITTNGTNSLTITLSNSDRTTVAGLTTPQLDIEAGAVSDTSGNQIAAAADQAITINDTIRPTFSSAAYATGSGELAITFSEPLDSSKHVATKLHVRESGSNSGGVTLSNGTITTNGTNSLTITLSNSDRTTVAGLTTPQLDIEAGAVSDTSGNQIAAAADQAITVNDTIRPTFSSAAYATGSGELAITFSEPLDSSKHVATKLHVRESGSNSGGVTLSNGTITTNGTNSLTITLSNSDRTTVAGLTTPQLDIEAGAVSDTSGNQIAAAADQAITVNDTIKPTISSATYYADNGTLAITFSESLNATAHNASKIHILESGQGTGSVTLSNGTITTNGTNSLTITLSNSDRTTVAGLTTPQLDIEAGAVQDTAGNPIDATLYYPLDVKAASLRLLAPPAAALGGLFIPPEPQQTLLVMHDDNIRPEIVSTRADMSGSTLTVTFDEYVTVYDWSGFVLKSGQNILTLIEPFGDGSRHVSAKIYGNLSDTITLDMAKGTVLDVAGNANPPYANLIVELTAPPAPTIELASYDNSTGVLEVAFDQVVMPGNLSGILLNGHALGMLDLLDTLSGNSLYFTPNATYLNALNNTIHVLTGAVLDGDGVPFMINQTVPLHLSRAYMAPPKAVYDTASDAIWLDMDGEKISLNGSAITISNSTTQVLLSDTRTILNGIAQYWGNATISPGNATALYMDIPAGAIRADSGTVPATDSLPVEIFRSVNTAAISRFPAGNDTVSVSLMPPGLAIASSLQGISVFDMADAFNHTAFVALNTAILDMNPLPNTDYLAVLIENAVLFLNLEEPASPKWTGILNFTDAATHGTVTPLAIEGVQYVAVVTENGIALVLVSDPAKPKVVSRASVPHGSPEDSGSASSELGKLYMSLLPERICIVDVTSQYVATCETHHGTPDSMDAVMSGDALYLASTTDSPGVSIRTVSLEEVLSVGVRSIPADIGIANVYGTAYVLVAANTLYAFDVSGDTIYRGAGGPYISLDVAEFGGSPYAALLDADGTIHVINLGSP